MQLATPYPLSAAETEPLAFYAQPGPLTDPGPHAALFDRLPPDVSALVEIVHNVLLHVFWTEKHGLHLPEARQAEVSLRAVADMLSRLQAISPGPLTAPRAPEERLIGNCRHFATLLAALLRDQGLPSRARCGFATYLNPGTYEDHWVCEYWDASALRWVAVDAQLDALQRRTLALDFDPLDVPADRFLPAGRAWKLARQGEVDPNCFGIFALRGLDFIRGNLLRDLAALNKVELLPWDAWGLIERPHATLTPADLALLDHIAALSLETNDAFADLRHVYTTDPRLTAPVDLYPSSPAATQPIAA